jgi:two-component system, chemotaxis family, protein-glutamate methylesterase/glutaminase
MPDAIPNFEPGRFGIVAIGSSTGGPNLVQQMIAGLPADMPVPILIAQHLPPKFTRDLAVSMDQRSALTVVEAEDGQPVFPGTVYIGPGRMHMRVIRGPARKLTIRVSDQPTDLLYKPSVDELFDACAQAYGRGVLGIVMTGIGRDGTQGATRVVKAGGVILTQSRATCAVYGMPRSCDAAGLSSAKLSPEDLRLAIHQLSPSFERHTQDRWSGRSA